ncbi:DUF4396 domain-containing protein [Pontibacter actiniarum]|uniref:DUF4396 domain-containing protein n=1 Tax=Pontibacter actiniarum TaxID=323450 RepID=A0A1X9YYP5_9BACT|nr:DUF4396 domain-containing protein [Pontibacter actiniarum]ARS37999.1 hypothetical protein CA264_20825 [Pontibacter actiniarum]
MKWTYPVLTFLVVLILGLGLVNVLKEDLEVAPWTEKGAMEGRMIAHTKNVTRVVAQNATDLHEYLKTAIPYEEAKVADMAPSEKNWQEFVTQSIKVADDPRHVLVLPGGSKEALQWALPAIYYAFYYGSPVLFVENGQLTGQSAAQYRNLKAFIIGPDEFIPSDIEDNFEEAERVAGKDLTDHAIKIAEMRDEASEFGWGRVRNRRTGYFHYVVTTPKHALEGLAALPYAVSNNASLLYAGDEGGLPAALDRYVWSQRTDWMVSPSEGPFKHFWVVSNDLSYAAQGRMDLSIEKAAYASMGDISLGYMEALAIMLIVLGIASAIFVMIHSTYTLHMVHMPIKIAWAMTSLVLPVLGPILYLNAYRRPAYKDEKGMWHWLRPQNIQSAAATAMGFGYGAPTMIAVGFLFVWFGFPIFFPEWIEGPFFWLGAGMPIMMIAMYVLTVLIVVPMVQYPMKEMMMDMPKKKLAMMAFKTTAVSMAAVSLGMMTTAWWTMMYHIPMMPKEDDILWFGVMWLASFAGFLVAWPLNWLMIRSHLKPGNV